MAVLGRRNLSTVPALAALLALGVGCQTAPPAPDRSTVGSQLSQRFDQTIPAQSLPEHLVMPPGASFDDGITEDEAIVIALWNNAAFQELLVDLGVARGDLVQAGLLPNPEFIYLFGTPDKPFKYLLDFPLESLWLRPIRVKSATREAARVADRLAQGGLDLIRDLRQSYADVLLAHARLSVAREGVKLRGRVAELAQKRLEAGDISLAEAATARIDSFQAQQDLARVEFDVPVAEERLRNLMGTGPLRGSLPLDPLKPPGPLQIDPDELTDEAMTNRPDALAAAEAVDAALARLRFAKIGWVRLLGVIDSTSGRKSGHELGPGLRFTVPVFNVNQGNIARAEAELERARRNQETVAYQIILDVQRSNLQFQQAHAELAVLQTKVRPEVEAAISRAQVAYQEGHITIFVVLETTRQLLDTHLLEARLRADLRRFWAELERSVGRRLAGTESEGPIRTQAGERELAQPAPPPKSDLPAPKPLPPMENGGLSAPAEGKPE